MKLYIFLFLMAVTITNTLFAQDTLVVYFDKDWKEISNKELAAYYRIAYANHDKTWTVNDYFISKHIQMSGIYTSKSLKVQQGNCVFYYESGIVKSNGNYYNNKKDGFWSSWHENGEIKSEGKYENGLREGVWKYYYDNGQNKALGNYRSGNADGKWLYWDESGEKEAEGKYDNDIKAGIWSYWYYNGNLKCVETYKNKNSYAVVGYFENGKISYKGNYVGKDKDGEWTFWTIDDRISFTGFFRMGKQEGTWTRYFPEGEMKIYYVKGVPQNKVLGGMVINNLHND